MRFTSSFVLASLVLSSLAATVANVETDIANIQTQLTNLDNSVKAFPTSGGTLTEALAIHTSATNLNSAITTTTSDASTLPDFSETDGRTILTDLEGLGPTINDSLTQLIARKAAFAALPLGGVTALVQQDLATLNASTFSLEDVLIARTPADLLSEAEALQQTVNANFANAIAAFAS